MARVLGVQQGALNAHISRNKDSILPVLQAKLPTATGLKTHSLYSVDTLYDLAFKYNLPLANKMADAHSGQQKARLYPVTAVTTLKNAI